MVGMGERTHISTADARSGRESPASVTSVRVGSQPQGALQAGSDQIAWLRQFGSAIPADDESRAVAVDATGVYVAGVTRGAFPGQMNAGGPEDIFVAKYDRAGGGLWSRQFGSSASDRALAIAVDATGVYVAGYTPGTLPGQTSAGGVDAFLAKYTTDGDLL
ncbi:MAG: hypothetical protein E6K18_08915 [Methanobacteriota archaeon]|nr:MAG: hypothetical protein E6K18_08915 [Euryarchaeota archaeon]